MDRGPLARYCARCGTPLEQAVVGGRARPACPRPGCGHVEWDNPTPVVAAIVEQQGHVLLVRSRGWPRSWFGLVTGFLEAGETPEEGVLREVAEEVGLSGSLQGLVGVYPFLRRNQLLVAYHVRVPPGPVRLQADELADYRRVPVWRLRPWSAGTGLALRDWLAARGFERPLVPFGEHLAAEDCATDETGVPE